jgi:hypothetical protein
MHVINLDSIDRIAAGELSRISVTVSKDVHLKMLLIAPATACCFEVWGIVVGGEKRLFEGSFPIFGEAFSTTATESLELDFGEASEGETITLEVCNVSAGPVRFRGLFVVKLLRDVQIETLVAAHDEPLKGK